MVLPNSVGANQVSINLTGSHALLRIVISIRLDRDADIQAARALALHAASGLVGEKAVTGCTLTRFEATSAVLELRVLAPDAASSDAIRAALLAAVAAEFRNAGLAESAGERPTFS